MTCERNYFKQGIRAVAFLDGDIRWQVKEHEADEPWRFTEGKEYDIYIKEDE
jgi:hypothetical protein